MQFTSLVLMQADLLPYIFMMHPQIRGQHKQLIRMGSIPPHLEPS